MDHQMSVEFETPHTKWAKPYARGKLRVLLFCSGHGTAPREGVELKQRFDFDVDAVFWARIVDSTKQGWHGGELGVQRMLRLAEKPYDCYLFLGISPASLSSEMQYKILKPVTDGAGIVLVGLGDRRILKPERRIKELSPFLSPAGVAGAFQVGKGRGVELPKLPDIPYEVGWETEYDHWQERLGRAILWAAGKEPQVELRPRLEAPELDRSRLPQKAVGFSWRNPRRTELSIEMSIRSRQGWRLPYWEVKTADAEGEVLNEFLKLRADDYYLDVIARSGNGVEAWAASRFKVASDHGVKSVELSTTWGEVGDTLRGTISLDADLGNKEWVEVRLWDRRNRILMRRRLVADQLAFEFRVEPWFPMLVRVEAVRCYGGGDIASAHAWFNVVKRNRGQFNFLIWDVPTGSLAPYAEESLARLGMTLQLKGGTPPRYVAAYETAWVPYTTRIQEAHDKDGVMKPFCWNDEAKAAAHVQALADKYREARQHGVFVYSLGDENDVRGSCTSPHCLRAYRQYLAKEYVTIEALNAS
ncbi:MAG: beta-galactosidase, partial [Gemmatimonadetes bacterium]|nr:beta-galactosidase [Gemmatimonadota bacterium]